MFLFPSFSLLPSLRRTVALISVAPSWGICQPCCYCSARASRFGPAPPRPTRLRERYAHTRHGRPACGQGTARAHSGNAACKMSLPGFFRECVRCEVSGLIFPGLGISARDHGKRPTPARPASAWASRRDPATAASPRPPPWPRRHTRHAPPQRCYLIRLAREARTQPLAAQASRAVVVQSRVASLQVTGTPREIHTVRLAMALASLVAGKHTRTLSFTAQTHTAGPSGPNETGRVGLAEHPGVGVERGVHDQTGGPRRRRPRPAGAGAGRPWRGEGAQRAAGPVAGRSHASRPARPDG